MNIVSAGEHYQAHTAKGEQAFDIVFCKNENGVFIDGVTNEELIEVLIHRMTCLVKKKPSTENMNTLTHLNQAKSWMNVRNLKKMKSKKEV